MSDFPTSPKQFYTTTELADLAGMHRNTIKGYAVRGKIPAFKMRGKTGIWLITVEDGDAFLESIKVAL